MIRFQLLMVVALAAPLAGHGEEVRFQQDSGCLHVFVGDEPFARYVYADSDIPRPYFCEVKAPGGLQVTRNHPPDPKADAGNDDHATFHPGLWLAFGDLGGADFWRIKAQVRHVRFAETPQDGATGTFTVVNAYETLDTPPRVLCEETCRYTVKADRSTRRILAESRFKALVPGVCFGDQEEMGFGVRLATPLTMKHGNGTLVNSAGGVDEDGTWGKQADWCAFSGVIGDRRAGILLAAGPDNFRRSWFHNRDYGLMVANPFGRKAMTGPDDKSMPPDATPLNPDTPLSLTFAVCVFNAASDEQPDYAAWYQALVKDLAKETRADISK